MVDRRELIMSARCHHRQIAKQVADEPKHAAALTRIDPEIENLTDAHTIVANEYAVKLQALRLERRPGYRCHRRGRDRPG